MTTAPRTLDPAPTLEKTGAVQLAARSLQRPVSAVRLPGGAVRLPGGAVQQPADAVLLPTPQALLLDFGGVVVSTASRPSWAKELADLLVQRARPVGLTLEAEQVEDSLRAGRAALSMWKNAASRRLAPRELAPSEIVADFLLADLPATARAALSLDAAWLLAEMAPLVADHRVRPGIPALLAEAEQRGLRLGIVSNAHSGRAHRQILDDLGLARFFGVQIYSDEIGIRKPHPGMILAATEALGVDPGLAWYVGDTLDRDVAAGRRADVGAVVITRDRRTDHPPFPVAAAPDLVLETPEELIAQLRAACDRADAAAPAQQPQRPSALPSEQASAAPPASPLAHASANASAFPSAQSCHTRRPALLLDHGGVITSSVPNPQRNREIGELIVGLSQRIGCPIDSARAQQAVADGWDRHRARKRSRDAVTDPAHQHDEIDPSKLWGDLVGADLPAPLRAALRLEARQLSFALHRTKSTPAPRAGAIELIRWCQDRGIVVGIVSNTISGRGVREILARYGVADAIGPGAYSDEIGVRKPGGAIFEAALAGLATDRADVVYVGDKVLNDGHGGRDAGIGTVCLLRGGKDSDDDLARALDDGIADHVLDGPAAVIDVLAAKLASLDAKLASPDAQLASPDAQLASPDAQLASPDAHAALLANPVR